MHSFPLKAGIFLIEGLNSFSITLYLYYVFFFTQESFGFSRPQNLALAAMIGFIYIFGSVFGGRFGQRRGYFLALRVGLLIISGAMIIALFVENMAVHLIILAVYTAGTCFTWPALEAMISERESPLRLQHLIGIYNLVWAGTGAIAYFGGGALIEQYGLKVLFWCPLLVHVVELGLVRWLESRARSGLPSFDLSSQTPTSPSEIQMDPTPVARTKAFLQMAWLANPLAYIAINTLIPTIPALAKRMEFSPKVAGFVCSAWLFARTAAFLCLWFWPGWHYRFRWMAGAYLTMLACFALILSASDLWLLIGAQVLFGAAVGLIYYSSLYYSMDVGETKGEHGGIHEAAIGAGNFVGPAVGAAALHFLPARSDAATWVVSGLLFVGFLALTTIHTRNRIPA